METKWCVARTLRDLIPQKKRHEMEKGPESCSNSAVNHCGPSPNRSYEKVKGSDGRREREELVVGLCRPEEGVPQAMKTFWALKGAVSGGRGEKRYPGG